MKIIANTLKIIMLMLFITYSLPSNAGMITKAVGAYVAYKVITKNKEEKEQKQQSTSEDHYRYSSDEECEEDEDSEECEE